eukprot:11217193-Lingulodinium_polyedra.AAC.1
MLRRPPGSLGPRATRAPARGRSLRLGGIRRITPARRPPPPPGPRGRGLPSNCPSPLSASPPDVPLASRLP